MRITARIIQEIDTFVMPFTKPNGEEFDHYETIKKIELHREGKFYNCDDATAIFWSLGDHRAPKYAKKFGIKPRNLRIKGKGDLNYYASWVSNMRFDKWAKESGYSVDLNDLEDGIGDYGSTVMKLVPLVSNDDEYDKVAYDFQECNFNKLYFDTSKRPINSGPVIEEHEMDEYELREMDSWLKYIKKNGKSLKDVMEKAEKVNSGNENNEENNQNKTIIEKYKIYERCGVFQIDEGERKEDFNQHCVDLSDYKPHYLHGFYCGNGVDEIVLWEEEIEKEDCPYYDFHSDKYKDRFLGVGAYERIFAEQKMANELVNWNRDANRIASLLLLYSKEKGLHGTNLIQEAQSGDIYKYKLEQMGIDNRFVNEFLAQLQAIEIQADKKCMLPEPSDTVRGQIMESNEIVSAFETSGNRILSKIAKVLEDKILPSVVEKWNDEDVFEIANDEIDIQMYDFIAIKKKINSFIAKAWAQKYNPSPQEKQIYIQSLIAKWDREGRKITDMKGFFSFGIGVYVDFNGKNENLDKKNALTQWIVTMILSNPAAANIPYIKKMAEDNGIAPHKMSNAEMNQLMQSSIRPPQMAAPKEDAILSQKNER